MSDLNDNLPLFSQSVYFAYLEDTAQLNHPLKFENDTRIRVMDEDQVSFDYVKLSNYRTVAHSLSRIISYIYYIAGVQHFLQDCMFAQRRLGSVCASKQSD